MKPGEYFEYRKHFLSKKDIDFDKEKQLRKLSNSYGK